MQAEGTYNCTYGLQIEDLLEQGDLFVKLLCKSTCTCICVGVRLQSEALHCGLAFGHQEDSYADISLQIYKSKICIPSVVVTKGVALAQKICSPPPRGKGKCKCPCNALIRWPSAYKSKICKQSGKRRLSPAALLANLLASPLVIDHEHLQVHLRCKKMMANKSSCIMAIHRR